jgi:hypothetical protein
MFDQAKYYRSQFRRKVTSASTFLAVSTAPVNRIKPTAFALAAVTPYL